MKKKTTVDLTDYALLVKNGLTDIFSLRNVLSAGLIILNKLTDEDINKAIAEANGLPTRVDLYNDREKLIKIRKIIEEASSTQDGGINISYEDCHKIFDIIGVIQPPSPSFWHVEFVKPSAINTGASNPSCQKQCTKISTTNLEKAVDIISSTRFHILSKEDSRALEKIRKLLGPNPKKKKNAG